MVNLEGSNKYGLSAPDDEKSWVGVYHYVEKVTMELYLFSSQSSTERFINQNSDEKITFEKTYAQSEHGLIECLAGGISVRGGTVLVSGSEVNEPLVFASSKRLDKGIHRVICRLYSPGCGLDERNIARPVSVKQGAIGILRASQRGDWPTNKWAERQDFTNTSGKDECIFGMKYDADIGELILHSNPTHSFLSSTSRFTVDKNMGDLYIAAELFSSSVNVPQTVLSIRYCDADEWEQFIERTHRVP